jgi:hypothetical protein
MKDTCTHFLAAYLPLSLTTAIRMAKSDASVSEHDSESSLSESHNPWSLLYSRG